MVLNNKTFPLKFLGIERHSTIMMKQICLPKINAELCICGCNAFEPYLHSDLAEETLNT